MHAYSVALEHQLMVLTVDRMQTQRCLGHTVSLHEGIFQANHACAPLTEVQTSGCQCSSQSSFKALTQHPVRHATSMP